MSVSASLGYLTTAVEEALGDIASVFETSFIQRQLNAGQARLEPDLLRQRTSTLTWSANATTAALPVDLAYLDGFMPDSAYRSTPFPDYVVYAGSMLFADPLSVQAWQGKLMYRAHFPTITADQDCLLPDTALDALVSFALHRCFRQLAAGRSEYRKYSTLVGGNAVSVSELEQSAQLHLQDFEDGRASAAPGLQPPPAMFWN